MQKSELDNANPTIRDVSQLPSRRGKQAPTRRGPEYKYDDLIFGKNQGSVSIFARNVSSWPSDDEDDDEDYADEGGYTEEPIDEQEIYGTQCTTISAARIYHEPSIAWRLDSFPLFHHATRSSCPRQIMIHDAIFIYSALVAADQTTDVSYHPDLISTISDPEHPHTLGQLSVINLADIHITPSPLVRTATDALHTVLVEITPTITHCSLATVIGLAVRVRLERALPPNYRVDIKMKEGSHAQDDQVNKQLADKERVAAALENDTLKGVIDKMFTTCVRG
jgi:metal-sulfur cluster biosynthetic enzyme